MHCISNFFVSQGLSTKGTKLIDANGAEIIFKGISWFGFQSISSKMVDGLDMPTKNSGDSISYNFGF